jgi:4-amino-4-deoxy-L-arabinose transferase-like glycosyltransferase
MEGAGVAARNGRTARLAAVCALVALVMVSVITGFLLIPDRDVDTGPGRVALTATGKAATLRVGDQIDQELTAEQDRISGVVLNAGVAHLSPTCALQVEVRDANQELFTGQTPCAALDDSIPSARIARFTPVEDSAGQRYHVTYTLTGGADDVIVMELGRPADPASTSALYGPGTLQPEDRADTEGAVPAAIPVYDGGSVLTQMRTALERASVFGPWWAQPGAVLTWSVLAALGLVAAPAVARLGRVRIVGALVALVAVGRSLVWAAVIPMLYGMDEPQHASYVQYLAEQGLPGQSAAALPEAYSPQLSTLLGASNLFGVWPTDRYDFTAADTTLAAVAQASPMSDGRPLTAQYSPTYYALAALFYRLSPSEGVPRLFDARLASVLLGVVCAAAVFWFFVRLFDRHLMVATALSLAVVVQPMFCHQFAIINNDALVITGSILLMAAAMSLIRGGGLGACVVMGIGGALAVLGKPQGVLVLPIALAAVVVAATASQRHWRTFWARSVQFLGVFALCYVWWPVLQRVRGLGNLEVPTKPLQPGEDRSLAAYLLLQVQGRATQLRGRWVNQLFGNFAWLDVWFPSRVYKALAVLTVALVMMCALWVLWRIVARMTRRMRGRSARHLAHTGDIWLCLGIVVLFLAGIHAVGFVGFRADGTDTILQGRYVLPMIPALFALPPLVALHAGSALSRDSPTDGVTVFQEDTVALPRWSQSAATVITCAILAAMITLSVLGIGSIAERFLW